MELGNLLYGHSRGNYSIDRIKFEKLFGKSFTKLLNILKCDIYGYYMGNNSTFKTKLGGFTCELFEINPYYWGECDCGYEDGVELHHQPCCSLIKPNFVRLITIFKTINKIRLN